MNPDEIERDVSEVLARSEFDYGPSWWDRAVEWLAERLEDLLGPLLPSAGTFGGGASSLVAWIIIVVAAALVVFAVVRAVRNRRRRDADDDATPFEVRSDAVRPASHWRAEAERHESAGDWRAALRSRVRQMVRILADEGLVSDTAGRTTAELRAELDASAARCADDADAVFSRFEAVWYGGADHGPDAHDEVTRHVDAVADAAPGDAAARDAAARDAAAGASR